MILASCRLFFCTDMLYLSCSIISLNEPISSVSYLQFSEQTIKFSSLIYLPPFLSNDDKARVAPGLAAASLQAPNLMHLEYKVSVSDHAFVVAPRHTLIPSVYGVCEVRQNGDLSVSGDTFNRVRSGKQDSSSAYIC